MNVIARYNSTAQFLRTQVQARVEFLFCVFKQLFSHELTQGGCQLSLIDSEEMAKLRLLQTKYA